MTDRSEPPSSPVAGGGEELNPCPFCGRRMTRADDFYRHAFQRRGALCVAESIAILAGDEKGIAAWNNRFPRLLSSPRVEEMREALEETLPRYIELFEAAGLGNADESIAVQIMRAALSPPQGE